ncbi:hypothetical protein TESG_07621, partial [Trichophyton tonsurans CBS 112818]
AKMEGMNGNHIMAEDNIINRRGGESLFQNCSNLKKRLAEVPGFEPHLAEMQELDKASDENDPVASVWKCLRQGYPLMTIYNATHPSEPLSIDENKLQERNRPKAATFKFLQACLQVLKFPQQECFLITDLYGDSTTGFVKVIKMVNRVIDILELQGQLYNKVSPSTSLPSEGGKTKLTRREHILKEMLETERDYVHHLQNLQALKKELEETGALTGDVSHQIFLNLNNLLDFTQRFLIRMEQHNALPEETQNWGDLYLSHHNGFLQYEPFIANQPRCDQICQREWDKIHSAPRSPDLQQMVAQLSTLNGFFVKPFQRLTKYPLMLMELRKQTENPGLVSDISEAINMIQIILDNANRAIDKEHLVSAVEDLSQRVEDWKALKLDQFGDLLRYGTFTILKGDSGKDAEREVRIILSNTTAQSYLLGSRRKSFTGSVIHLLSANSHRSWSWKQPKDTKYISVCPTPTQVAHPLELLTPTHSASTKTLEFNTPPPRPWTRLYHIYLFEQILLCCKDIYPAKQKSKLMGKEKVVPNPKVKPKLQLKGRIYMTNVTEILSLSKPGSYKIQIFWKGDPGVVDNFGIRYRDEDTMNKWYKDIDKQRALQTHERPSSKNHGTSETEFTYLRNTPKPPNPYQEEYSTEEELSREPTNTSLSEFSTSRNASNTSLRGRSATNGSGGSGHHSGGRPQFPTPNAPLTVHTQFAPGAVSPGERNGASYFSPTGEAPSSTRSSSQSTAFSYSRGGTPSNAWTEAEQNRYTAPAMPRSGSRDGSGNNPYYNNGSRNAQRPSLPPFSSNQNGQSGSQSQAQARMRSASSPDIHNGAVPDSRRYMNGGHTMQTVDNVPVPPIPPHMANMRAPVNRSQNSSPTGNTIPIRSGTQSPNLQPPPSRHGHAHPPPVGYNYEPHAPNGRPLQPPTSMPQTSPFDDPDSQMPSQLKAKINFDDNYVTLVIASNILFRSLTDRVDAKLARFTDRSIGGNSARLRYRDEDGDFVTIDSDEAVQLAFMEWREQHQHSLAAGQVGEIQLFCQPVEN